jgi:hypothetical protein
MSTILLQEEEPREGKAPLRVHNLVAQTAERSATLRYLEAAGIEPAARLKQPPQQVALLSGCYRLGGGP